MKPHTFSMSIPIPHRDLSPNVRAHWRAKARAARRLREEVCTATLVATNFSRPQWKAATVLVRAYFATKRARDKDNVLSSLKAAFDGLKDAGLILDDVGLTHLPMELGVDPENPRVELVVTRSKA